MPKMDAFLAAHPIRGLPYNKLVYVRIDHNRVPLYSVEGSDGPPVKASEALGRAFQLYGGKCFYCPERFEPQAFSPKTAHRDHVVAESAGGSSLLHNLVVACQRCGAGKGDGTIHDFRPKAANAYLAALERHIKKSVQDSGA